MRLMADVDADKEKDAGGIVVNYICSHPVQSISSRPLLSKQFS